MRVVAGSMQVTYPGSELSRAGRVHYGQTTGGMIDGGDVPTPDGIAATLNNWGRTPSETIQLNIRPGASE